MPGMLLKGGASALVGSGVGAQPPLMAGPAAATTAQSASEIAYGPRATPTTGGSGLSTLLGTAGGHSVLFWGGLAGLVGLTLLYRSLPK